MEIEVFRNCAYFPVKKVQILTNTYDDGLLDQPNIVVRMRFERLDGVESFEQGTQNSVGDIDHNGQNNGQSDPQKWTFCLGLVIKIFLGKLEGENESEADTDHEDSQQKTGYGNERSASFGPS
jgi:hypothetical protein